MANGAGRELPSAIRLNNTAMNERRSPPELISAFPISAFKPKATTTRFELRQDVGAKFSEKALPPAEPLEATNQ